MSNQNVLTFGNYKGDVWEGVLKKTKEKMEPKQYNKIFKRKIDRNLGVEKGCCRNENQDGCL